MNVQLGLEQFVPSQSQSADMPMALRWLIAQSAITVSDAERALERSRLLGVSIYRVLINEFGIVPWKVQSARAATLDIALIDPMKDPGDPLLLAELGPKTALHMGLLPWRKVGTETVVLTAWPERFGAERPALEATFGPVRMALATEDAIRAAVRHTCGKHLEQQATHRLDVADSCRNWNAKRASGIGFSILAGSAMLHFAGAPIMEGGLLVAFAACIAYTVLTIAAALASMKPGRKKPQVHLERLPTFTILIPLFQETHVAEHLLTRLKEIEYPAPLLDVCLILEDCDELTHQTLSKITLPPWIRIITVPDGAVRTKPKALNYAIYSARGEIIGIYDAEDAPARSQLMTIAQGFAQAPPDVACLQGTLDYYNSSANWFTRCFTIEYASWFRVVLPGFARLGLAVPLGGTTLFFRRSALDKIGAWDAHNVTEDADLGIRLARRGFRTEFAPTVTQEEANGKGWPWVRQRSRWLKGYAMTYFVHMRHPLSLLRELGLWKFTGFQILFLGTLLPFTLAPLMWSLWLLPITGSHPAVDAFGPWLLAAFLTFSICANITNLGIAWLGLKRAGKSRLFWWSLTLALYFPLATAAMYKGLWELCRRPFYWDKTAHGINMKP